MSSLPEVLSALSDGVNPALVKACSSAMDAREQVQAGALEDDLETIHANLVGNRAQIERLEHLTATLLLIRSRLGKVVAQRKGELEDAYTLAATKKRVSFAEYTSAKEKDAAAAAETVAETVAFRRADLTYRDADSAWDFCRLLLRGAENTHRDLELRLRLISLSSQLDH